MKALELAGEIDQQRQIHLTLPKSMRPGPVRVLVLVPEAGEDSTGAAWSAGIAREWAAELADENEDVYTLEDGEPIHAAR